MSKAATDIKIAIIGKNQILEDELINGFSSLGIEEKNIISMDDEFNQISFDVEDEEARFYLPLEKDRLKDFDCIFLVDGLTQSRIDLFESVEEKFKIFVLNSDSSKQAIAKTEKDAYFYVPSPEIFVVSEILKELSNLRPRNFYWSLYESVSSKGKEGIKELFDQTREVLNFSEPKTNVFKKQIAFSIIPQKPELSEEAENEIRKRTQFKGILYRNTIDMPLFYGTYLTFFVELNEQTKELKKDLTRFFEANHFFELKKDVLDIAAEKETKPSLFIDVKDNKCIFGVVFFDSYKLMVEIAVKSFLER